MLLLIQLMPMCFRRMGKRCLRLRRENDAELLCEIKDALNPGVHACLRFEVGRFNDQVKEKHAKVCYNIFCNFRRMRLQKWPILQCQKVHIAKVDFFTIPRKGLSR